jgi:hypothetical protein
MSQSKCTSEYYSLLRRSTLRVPDVYRSAEGKIHLSLGASTLKMEAADLRIGKITAARTSNFPP